MNTYFQWAAGLVRYFFGSQAEGQRVRLMVTRDVLDQDFANLGGANGFLMAMLKGPSSIHHVDGTVFRRGLMLHNMWTFPHLRTQEYPVTLLDLDDAPPFLPYLCLLCLAWTEGGEEVAANAYYERLTRLILNHDLNGNLGDWLPLWQGLEDWTTRIAKRRGHFIVEKLGGLAHVGIPRSQVIFTPAKIGRFSELFLGCGLEPEAAITCAHLRVLLLAREAVALSVLGPMVFREIQDERAIGISALEVLREHLANWDGDCPNIPNAEGGGISGHANVDQLLLALCPVDNTPPAWQATFAVNRDARCEQVTFPTRQWKLRPHSETLAAVVANIAGWVDATEFNWTAALTLHARLQDNGDPTAELAYRLPEKTFRLFDRWEMGWLVECKNLPMDGPVYILVHNIMLPDWQAWTAAFTGQVEVLDFTRTGLPARQRLFCIPDLSQLPGESRAAFPGGGGKFSGRNRHLRIIGGSRCNASTARRVYAEYDPPLLIVQSPASATLSIVGAEATLINGQQSPDGLPGNAVHSYSLRITDQSPVVVATLKDAAGQLLGAVAFGVHHEQHLLAPVTPTVSFDPIGNLSDSGGATGMLVPGAQAGWEFENGPHKNGNPLPDSIWHEPSFRLLDSLSLHGARLAYPEYKRRCMVVANAEGWRVSEETRWLASLGHIDLQTDSRGRWSHLHPVPTQLYPLPWLFGGRYQFVLTGTTQTARLREIVELAVSTLECEIRVTPSKHKLVPPRITLLHGELAAGAELAKEMGLGFAVLPPAIALPKWAGTLDTWLETIKWFPDPGPNPYAEYSPEAFRFVPHEQYAAPWHLRRFLDPFTMQQWHCLYRKTNWEHGEQHAYVRDFSWAMWRVHMAIADGSELTNLVYDDAHCRLVVPCQLNFPYLLARALVACSGLPPETLYNVPAYMQHGAGVLMLDAAAYSGQCTAYQLVPQRIAELIASKVNARLVNVRL